MADRTNAREAVRNLNKGSLNPHGTGEPRITIEDACKVSHEPSVRQPRFGNAAKYRTFTMQISRQTLELGTPGCEVCKLISLNQYWRAGLK